MAKRDDRRGEDRGVYIISVAAELAGVHPQTLRIYELKGLLNPSRTAGNTRRYSERDIERLEAIHHLTQDFGINLAGVKMIVELEAELERLRKRMEAMARELERARRTASERVRSREITDIIPLSAIRRFPWEVGS